MARFHKKNSFHDGSSEGDFYLGSQRVDIYARYSPERIAFIKSIPGARFHKEEKRWSIPKNHLEKLLHSPFFSPDKVTSHIPETWRERTPQEREKAIAKAQERWRKDPFTVPNEDLPALALEAVFVRSKHAPSLRLFCRYGSPARIIAEKLPSIHLVRNEKAWFVPTHALTELLKLLRDKKISWGIERTTCEILQEFSELRTQILEGASLPSSQELAHTLLAPQLVWNGETGALLHYTTTHLKDLFPASSSFHERKRAASSLTRASLLTLVHRSSLSSHRIFYTKEVFAILKEEESTSGSVHEALIDSQNPEFAWVSEHAGTGTLLVKKDTLKEHLSLHAGSPLHTYQKMQSHHYHERISLLPLPSKLLVAVQEVSEYFLKHKLEAPLQSDAFSKLLIQLSKRAELLAMQERFLKLKDTSLDYTFSSERVPHELFPHQRVAVSWLLQTPYAFLGDDMGLGKTLSVLTYFDALVGQNHTDLLLVVCPNSLVRNWHREASVWFPKKKIVFMPKEKTEKELLLRKLLTAFEPIDGIVINYEAVRLPYVIEPLLEILRSKKTLLCLDESQRVKNPQGKTFDALSLAAPLCHRRVLLSGTPTPKDITDIWAQFFLLDGGERFGKRYYDWLPTVAEIGNDYSDFAIKKLKPAMVNETIVRVNELLLRRKKNEVVSLPEKLFSIRDIELTGAQKTRYEEITKDLLLKMTSVSGASFVREIDSLLEQYLRAVQAASNPRLIDPTWKGEPAKFIELDTIIEEVVKERDEKIVVWTNYLGNVRELVTRYADYGCAPFSGEISPLERDATVQEFQKGTSLKVLIAVPAAGGVGITLTAAQTAVYIDKTWNAEHWLQSIDRIHRIGQTGTVQIISLHASKIDDLIGRNLRKKEKAQAHLLGDTKRTLSLERADEEFESRYGYPTREELITAAS